MNGDNNIPMNTGDALLELSDLKKRYTIILDRMVDMTKNHNEDRMNHTRKVEELRHKIHNLETTITKLLQHGDRKLTLRERITGRVKLPGGMSKDI